MKKLLMLSLLFLSTPIIPMGCKRAVLSQFLNAVANSGKRVEISLITQVLRYPELVAALNTAAKNGADFRIIIPEESGCFDESAPSIKKLKEHNPAINIKRPYYFFNPRLSVPTFCAIEDPNNAVCRLWESNAEFNNSKAQHQLNHPDAVVIENINPEEIKLWLEKFNQSWNSFMSHEKAA